MKSILNTSANIQGFYQFMLIKMSNIENLLYSAYEHGKRDQLYKKVTEIRRENKYMPLEEVYDKAYSIVMKTH